MLQYRTVYPATLELLKSLQTKPYLKDFYVQSLTYFEDAENDPQPRLLKKVSWQDVKEKIIETVKEFLERG